MAKRAMRVEIDNAPELLRLAKEVRATRQPQLLTQAGEVIAVLQPPPAPRRPLRTVPTSDDDPIWDIVGMAHADGPGNVADNVDRYLAEAYADTHE